MASERWSLAVRVSKDTSGGSNDLAIIGKRVRIPLGPPIRRMAPSFHGQVAERLKAPALNPGNGSPFVGSNPTLSAKYGLMTSPTEQSLW